VLINVSEDNDDAPDAELTSDTGTTTRLEAAVDAVVSSSAEASIESSQNAAERLDAMREQRDFAERILTTAPVIVLVLDLDGAIVRFNRCFEELTGYRLDEMRGANWLTTFLPEGDHESARAAFARTLRGEITPGTITPIRTKRGGKVHVEWHNTWIRDARANVCGSLSIGLDITRRRQPGKP
jgi:PAS domain S-box-containing protein